MASSYSKTSEYELSTIISGGVAALLVLILLSLVLTGTKKGKKRGVPVKVGGEEGYAMRHARGPDLVDIPWPGATTMAALFEQACKKYSSNRVLAREFIDKEVVTSSDSRKFEKLHLGEYRWQSYGEVFERVCNFASGLVGDITLILGLGIRSSGQVRVRSGSGRSFRVGSRSLELNRVISNFRLHIGLDCIGSRSGRVLNSWTHSDN
ncbi:long chain acyl-CoA synthetase 8-like isoform X1 [Raphanus sativus]|uniref:Long chain acyl-CoA synthetase 8-like isoform X1 n=1 Tax=Raphanus sativus TaxID=3726 RepID=A0A6J0NVR4_RAPSA|nr:long chain acyl-CoA synthetase 8-like isoform X1 [Raphanus sativus]